MANTYDYKAEFLRYMDDHGIKYTDRGEHVVRVAYSGENLNSIPVLVIFDEDGENMVQFVCFEVASYKQDKLAAGLITCNALNQKYRWVKFYLDDDNDIRVECDAYVSPGTAGEECMNMVHRVVSITDKAYPTIMKSIWD
ncbi:MAG: YbjN domain-containing protein [Ruminococcus sp.]|nr:YbjN domain-containing protein [Ruminococcus sp.]